MAKFPTQDYLQVPLPVYTCTHVELVVGDAAGTYTVPAPAGTRVAGGGTVVAIVFDGSPTLTIGDGDDVDGYLDNTDIALTTALTVTTPAVKLFEDGGNPYANGKYYPTADTVDYIWDPAAATTGRLIGWVDHINVREAGGLVAALAG